MPITPLRRCWSSSGGQCSRLQLPLTLAWAVTIHKSQGLTLDKVVIEREFSIGLTFVACSSVCQLQDLLFTPPFPYQRLSSLSNSSRLRERQEEDRRLQSLQPSQPTSSPWTTLGTQPRHSNHHSCTPVAHHCHHLLVDPPHTHTHTEIAGNSNSVTGCYYRLVWINHKCGVLPLQIIAPWINIT